MSRAFSEKVFPLEPPPSIVYPKNTRRTLLLLSSDRFGFRVRKHRTCCELPPRTIGQSVGRFNGRAGPKLARVTSVNGWKNVRPGIAVVRRKWTPGTFGYFVSVRRIRTPRVVRSVKPSTKPRVSRKQITKLRAVLVRRIERAVVYENNNTPRQIATNFYGNT